MLDLEGSGMITTQTDESCFTVLDIAKYIQYRFKGKRNVPLEEVYRSLESHPIFPADGYRTQIKDYLSASPDSYKSIDFLSGSPYLTKEYISVLVDAVANR